MVQLHASRLMKYRVGPDIKYSHEMVCEEVRKRVVKMIRQLIPQRWHIRGAKCSSLCT